MFSALILLVLTAPFILPGTGTMITLSAKTEIMDLTVVNPQSTRLTLAKAWVESEGACLTDIEIKPATGSTIGYSRKRGEALYITISGQATWTATNRKIAQQADATQFKISTDCRPDSVVRLPANGIISIGNESLSSPNSETLISSSMDAKVYGRAVDQLYALIPLNWGPFEAGTLYLAEELAVPAGSRLANARNKTGQSARWWGYVDVVFEDSKNRDRAMQVEASTNATVVDIFAPAPPGNKPAKSLSRLSSIVNKPNERSKSDSISVSLGSRLLKDPNLIWLYTLFAIAGSLVSLWKATDPNKLD